MERRVWDMRVETGVGVSDTDGDTSLGQEWFMNRYVLVDVR